MRLLQFDLRFLMFVMAVVGVGILWWKDRRELELRIAAIELRYKPFVGIGWSADQATGPPNTLVRGDQQTAWASATPDGQDEWLELSYEKTVTPYAVHIYETYNPGALTKVSAFDKAGNDSYRMARNRPNFANIGIRRLDRTTQKCFRNQSHTTLFEFKERGWLE